MAMRHTRTLCVLIVFGFSSTTADASDPVGIYAIIDRVVLEPDEESRF